MLLRLGVMRDSPFYFVILSWLFVGFKLQFLSFSKIQSKPKYSLTTPCEVNLRDFMFLL